MYITNQIFNNNISLYPSDLNKDIDNIILNKLKKTYEGYCKDNCFVLKNSINMINKTTVQNARKLFYYSIAYLPLLIFLIIFTS